MRTEQIEILIAVAETGSVTAAAKQVGLSQPAVTRSLQRLESEVNATLVDRSRRPLTLTPEGRIALKYGRRMIDTAQAMNRVGPRARSDDGPFDVRIGLGSTASQLLTESLARHVLLRNDPNYRVLLKAGHTDHLADLLLAGDLDVVVGNGHVLSRLDSVDQLDKFITDIGLFVRPDHPLLRASTGPIDYSYLQPYPVIGPRASPQFDELIEDMSGGTLSTADFQSLMCEDVASLARALSRTNAVLVTSAALIDSFLAAGQLAELPVAPKLNFPAVISIAVRSGTEPQPAAVAWIRETVVQTLAENPRVQQKSRSISPATTIPEISDGGTPGPGTVS